MAFTSSIYATLDRLIVRVLTVGCAIEFTLLIASSTNCWALPANGYSPLHVIRGAVGLSPSPHTGPALMSTLYEDTTPCKELPACQDYFILCGKSEEGGQLRRFGEMGLNCLLTIDSLICDRLKKFKKLPRDADLDPLGPLTADEVKEIFQLPPPPKPLDPLGAWDIDRYCLYVDHEIGSHGSSKICPNCKEEGEAWEAQKQCLIAKYRTYCPDGEALSSGCQLLRDTIDKAKSAHDFQNCLCKQTTSCELCHKACEDGGALPEWCDALKSTYCQRQNSAISPKPVVRPE